LIRSSARLSGPLGLALLTALAFTTAAPAQQNATPAAPELAAPQAPAPVAPVTFPKPDPTNFSAPAPSKQVIEDFLQTSWGKVENRVWQVQAILKTPVDGLAKVVVLIGDKSGKEQMQAMSFLAFADGKHFLAGDRLVTPGAATEPKPATPPAPAQPAPASTIDNPAYPKPSAASFTSASPTVATVEAFLHATWGFNDAVVWQIEAIQKTQLDGLSRVVVLFGDKAGKEKPQPVVIFALPDGKHIAAGDQIVTFGATPFADTRALLQKAAVGPFRGSPDKTLELVEFADFQCPHCKAAQANMDKLVVDYPKARIVFQSDPIPSIHPQSVKASEYGECVTKLAGSTAFFTFASALFEAQDALETPDGATLTINSALAKAGVDQTKAAACAAAPETKAAVEASMKLANDIGIYQVPTLMVNGRSVPANAPYDTLKKIIDFQIQIDGVK
jgi:protein-disulfide isomerase